MRHARMRTLAVASAFVVVAPGAAAPRPHPPSVARAPSTIASGFFSTATFVHAVAASPRAWAMPAPVRAVVVPHHWLAADLIVNGIRDALASSRIDRVVLLAPNHSGAGGAGVATSERAWTTPFGRIDADAEGVASLVRSGVARRQPEVLAYEHAVAGIVPAIAYFAPRARVVPLAVRARLPATGVVALARSLAAMLADPGTLLLASVDFAHYVTAAEARARNRETIEALRSSDDRLVASWGNEHLDAPSVMAALLRVVRTSRFTLLADSDATAYGSPPDDVTSYLVAAWS